MYNYLLKVKLKQEKMNPLIVFIGAIAIWKAITTFLERVLEDVSKKKSVSAFRKKYISKTMHITLFFVFLVISIVISGIEYTKVAIFMSSVIAVFGVAFIAQWSILSNITASVIIFFHFPYRIGDHITVVDKDGDIRGVIEEITLFHVVIRKEDEIITYPNNLILQKAVIKKDTLQTGENPVSENTTTARSEPKKPRAHYPY